MSLEWSPPLRANHRLQCLLNRKEPEPTLQSLLVSSFEPHDFKAILGSFQYVLERIRERRDLCYASFIDTFRIVFNKAGQIPDSIKEVGEKVLAKVSNMDPDLNQMVREHEKEYGSKVAPFIEGFEMGDICSKAEAFVSRNEPGTMGSKWDDWLLTLAYRARLIKVHDSYDAGKTG